MSTALHEPFHLDNFSHDDPQPQRPRHLAPVADEKLSIDAVPGALTADVRQAANVLLTAAEPLEEYAPAENLRAVIARSNVFDLPKKRVPKAVEKRHLLQIESMKKMTQTVGSAFVEAELGVRPFMQLSSWMELELFHKLRPRVEHMAAGKYLMAQRGDEDSSKVPSITPIGVRAAVCENGAWETSMTIKVGERARAVAMRLELHRERWRVTAFEIG